MFGSLVVVYPTRHEGGALLLRHGGEEWTFDSAELVRNHDRPVMAYVAFYSDVEHEVAVVQSGYRVTLTYNLYFENNVTLGIVPFALQDRLQASLTDALKTPKFLPKGGTLGFGLSFTYPVSSTSQADLDDYLWYLKGSDDVIKRVCNRLSLELSLRAIYMDTPRPIMMDFIPDISDVMVGQTGLSEVLCDSGRGGIVIYNYGEKVPEDDDGPIKNSREVLWITPLNANTQCETMYVAYGNQAGIGYAYANICLMVRIGPAGRRETVDDDSEGSYGESEPPIEPSSEEEEQDGESE